MKKESGQILVLAIVVSALVLINTLVIIAGSQIFSQNSNYSVQAGQAVALAEAGVDKAVASLNAFGGNYSGEPETALGSGSFSVVITTPDANTKVVESTGYVPSKANYKAKKSVKIVVSKGVGVAFVYGIQAAEGGLQMSNNSTVNGSVYSNGNIIMNNNARITGDAYVAGGTTPNPDQSEDCSSTNCTDFVFGKNIGGENRLDAAQSFQPTVSNVLNKVSLKLKKTGFPSDITVRLLQDNNGQPNKNQVIASTVLSAGLVGSDYGFVDVAFPAPPSLTSGTTYWIVLDASSDSSNYWSWSGDLLQGYTAGKAMWSPDWQAGNPSWNSVSLDLGFQTYLGGQATYIQGANGISIGGNTHAHSLKDLTITGGAYYQAATNITASSYHPGTPDPAVRSMPISEPNIATWKNVASDPNQGGGTYIGDITSCRATLGPGKYVGNVTFSNSCNVTIKGLVWITGDLNLNNNNILQLDPAFGVSSGVIIVDGVINIDNNNKLKGSGTAGSYLMALSTHDSTVDGSVAINVSNGGNTGILYTNKGIISLQNTNHLTEVSGWQIDLSNGVIIDYDTGLASSFFSSGPSGSYSLVKGTYQLK